MKSQVSVTNVIVTTVKPLELKDHVKSIQPSFHDLFTADLYLPVLFAYRLENSEEYLQFVSRVKDSLQKVLVPFFPFAGRWIPDGGLWTAEGRRGYLLLCNDEGVPFIEGYVDKDIDSVVRASGGFQSVPELNGYDVLGLNPSLLKQKLQAEGFPPIFVQVTRFKGGGVTVAVTFNHLHCDGSAFFDFMSSWAEVSRTGKISITPNVDRKLVTTLQGPLSELDDEERSKFAVLPGLLGMDTPLGANPTECTMRVYEVNAGTIKALKKNALENSRAQYISTNDCIVAELWRLSYSLRSSLTDGKPIAVAHLAEGRNRYCFPPLPHLVGNVMMPLVSPMPPSHEILKQPPESLAQNIREDILQKDWKTIDSVDSLKGLLVGFDRNYVRLWLNSSWTKFDLYGIDFGVGGKPYFSPGVNASHSWGLLGMSFIYPPIPGHSSSAASLSLYSSPAALDFMEKLPGFWNFFLPYDQQPNATDICSGELGINFGRLELQEVR